MSEIINKIKKVLECEVKPHLQADGGAVEFVDFDKKSGVLKVRFEGACVGCPMRQMTLERGVGMIVKEKINQVKEVVAE